MDQIMSRGVVFEPIIDDNTLYTNHPIKNSLND